MSDKLTSLEELALRLAQKEPTFIKFHNIPKVVHIAGRRYVFIDESDAGRLDNLRKIILLIIEERRKLS